MVYVCERRRRLLRRERVRFETYVSELEMRLGKCTAPGSTKKEAMCIIVGPKTY